MKKDDIFDELVKSWGCPIVARSELAKFSGGLLHGRTCANRDSLGRGIAKKITIGKKIGYSTVEVANWLRQRAKEVENG